MRPMRLLADALKACGAEDAVPSIQAERLRASGWPLGYCGAPCEPCTMHQLKLDREVRCMHVMRGERIRPWLDPEDPVAEKAAATRAELGAGGVMTDRMLCRFVEFERGELRDVISLMTNAVRARLGVDRLPRGLPDRIRKIVTVRYMALVAKKMRGRPLSMTPKAVRERRTAESLALQATGIRRAVERVIATFDLERAALNGGVVHINVDQYTYNQLISPRLGEMRPDGTWPLDVVVKVGANADWYTKIYRRGLARIGDALVLSIQGSNVTLGYQIGPGAKCTRLPPSMPLDALRRVGEGCAS